jgi:hypothetical protein
LSFCSPWPGGRGGSALRVRFPVVSEYVSVFFDAQ